MIWVLLVWTYVMFLWMIAGAVSTGGDITSAGTLPFEQLNIRQSQRKGRRGKS